MSEKKVQWSKLKCGALWVSRDDQNKMKNLNGEFEIDGVKTKVLIMKRNSFPDDVEGKKYPDFIIYNATKLDEINGNTKPASKEAEELV